MFKGLKALSLIKNSPATQKGYAAYNAGLPEDANPFSTETSLHGEWHMGWRDARRAAAANAAATGEAKAG